MTVVRWLLFAVLVALIGLGATYVMASRADGPALAVLEPSIVGRTSELVVSVNTPGQRIDSLTVSVEQGDSATVLFDLLSGGSASLRPSGPDGLELHVPIGRDVLPDLVSGELTVVVDAVRPLFWGLWSADGRTAHTLEVRLEPPRLAVVSSLHYLYQGGSEIVLYTVSPPDGVSGVQVGDRQYPGFPIDWAEAADPTLRIAFFALGHDESTDTPIQLFAIDPAGNQAHVSFPHQTFARRYRSSQIEVTDAFLELIATRFPDPQLGEGPGVAQFLAVNRDLRQRNADTIAAIGQHTAATMLWRGPFRQLTGSQVASAFADARTYVYHGDEIDHQTHLGFDLAKTAQSPIEAANRGVVVYAGDLGIYGNAVILDHGLGVQSLYAHLSSIEVEPDQLIIQGEPLGLSGQTGLAAGDHLHFSMLVHGQFVNATEWWDPGWIRDRIQRKLQEAGVVPGPVP